MKISYALFLALAIKAINARPEDCPDETPIPCLDEALDTVSSQIEPSIAKFIVDLIDKESCAFTREDGGRVDAECPTGSGWINLCDSKGWGNGGRFKSNGDYLLTGNGVGGRCTIDAEDMVGCFEEAETNAWSGIPEFVITALKTDPTPFPQKSRIDVSCPTGGGWINFCESKWGEFSGYVDDDDKCFKLRGRGTGGQCYFEAEAGACDARRNLRA